MQFLQVILFFHSRLGSAVESALSSGVTGNSVNEVVADGLVGGVTGKLGAAAAPLKGPEPSLNSVMTGSYVGKNAHRMYSQQLYSEAGNMAWQQSKNCLQ